MGNYSRNDIYFILVQVVLRLSGYYPWNLLFNPNIKKYPSP